MVDLRTNRRESELSEQDVAILLHTDQPRISRLEQGKAILNIREICKLCLIFNQPILELFRLFSYTVKAELTESLQGVSVTTEQGEQRQKTLHSLHQRLASNNPTHHETTD